MEIRIKETEKTIQETLDLEYLQSLRLVITSVMNEKKNKAFELSLELQECVICLYADVTEKTAQIKKITSDINKLSKKISELSELKRKLENKISEL